MGVGRATEVVDHITMPFTAYEYTVSFWGDHTTARVGCDLPCAWFLDVRARQSPERNAQRVPVAFNSSATVLH